MLIESSAQLMNRNLLQSMESPYYIPKKLTWSSTLRIHIAIVFIICLPQILALTVATRAKILL